MIGGTIQFNKERLKGIEYQQLTSIKTALCVPVGLNRETLKEAMRATAKNKAGDKDKYLSAMCKLLHKVGIIKNCRRVRITWNQ